MEEKRGWHSGKIRRLFKKECSFCKGEMWVPNYLIAKQKFCSLGCSDKGRQDRVVVSCAYCGSDVEKAKSKLANSKSGLSFCGRECKEKAQRVGGLTELHPEHYNGHSKGVLLRQRGHKCEGCGLTEWQGVPIPLERDHIDGNAYNNDESNLRLLCPNCHALTSTYCGRNRGKGRKSRRNNHPKLEQPDVAWPSKDRLAQWVCEQPVIQIAEELGVSASAVHRRCERLSIQKPPKGFWSRKTNCSKLPSSTS